MPRKISVLVVDDSAFMRKALKRMLNSDPMIKVVGEAKDGAEAVAEVKRLQPDVVTLDVKMSGMDGIEALKRIMAENPTPVLMVSSLTSDGGEITLNALAAGAVDFIDKSTCHTTMDIIEIADSLVQKVKVIAGVDINKVMETKPFEPPIMPPKPSPIVTPDSIIPSHLVVIGASTGGPMALENVLTALPANYTGAVLLVQHMPVGFTRSFAERLKNICGMKVKEANEDDPILPGWIYVAVAGYHMKIRNCNDKYRVILTKEPRDAIHCPSVDVLFKSAAETWPGRLLGVVLTGMGQDGAEGVREIKQRGGVVLAQDEATCVVFGMPKAALMTGCVDSMAPLNRITVNICAFK